MTESGVTVFGPFAADTDYCSNRTPCVNFRLMSSSGRTFFRERLDQTCSLTLCA